MYLYLSILSLVPLSPTPNNTNTHPNSLRLSPHPHSLSLSLSLSHKTESMKQNFHNWGVLFFLLFLITYSQTSATRFLTDKHGKMVANLSNTNREGSSTVDFEDNDSLDKLMGMEECGNGDEECITRRAIAEAHLDYIYTQHHKP